MLNGNLLEKKIIVYLIVVAVVLIFMSQYYIHDIIDRGTINTSQSATIEYPEKNDNDGNQNNGNNDNNTNNNGNDNKNDSNNNGNDNKNDNNNSGDDNNNDNNDNDDDNKNDNNNNQNTDDKKDDDVNIIDGQARIRILQGETEWSELKELDIFNQKRYSHVVEEKIAPGVQDVYAYTVENNGDYKMSYNMVFSDENPYNINMIYKLKINGVYVAGNENTWVKINELNRTNLIINPNTTDLFVLEWRWEDAENDTEIGITDGANYKLSINVTATQVE